MLQSAMIFILLQIWWESVRRRSQHGYKQIEPWQYSSCSDLRMWLINVLSEGRKAHCHAHLYNLVPGVVPTHHHTALSNNAKLKN